ncbi:carbon monoxide dehydrogenase [Peptoniphilus sp. AGMB00490]|uniref:Carbon monoxide dehydrogenase n=1 Tax=Peptoniphilus faecalis TaxID=2731255 RepID=A0A848RN78_9FIRM|nr:FAD binding domain-containing protein [Peptoniphilus faecalis]NMW85594.1 carbon monoxide dehydrogenase [Peptoniphilus faecalis]
MIFAPKDLSELCYILENKGDNYYILAGGTDLIIKIKNKKIVNYNIIEITKINELKGFKEDDINFYIGPLMTMTEIINEKSIKENLGSLYEAAYKLGSNQIRNLATIGGNVANASQSADCVLALFALDAKIKILDSMENEKIVSIEDFITGREKTILSQNEIIKEIIIPKKNSINIFNKIGSRTGVTISKISCAMNFILNEDGKKDTRIFLGAVGIKPVRAFDLEKVFANHDFKNINLEILQQTGFNEIEKAIPERSSKYYKRIAIQGLLEDMLEELISYEK